MAITKTTSVQRVEVYPVDRLMVVYNERFDDPDDDRPPPVSARSANHQDYQYHRRGRDSHRDYHRY